MVDERTFRRCVEEVGETVGRSNALGLTGGELGASLYFTDAYPWSVRDDLLQTLIEASPERKDAWDAANLIARGLIKEGRPLPPVLAEWTADVLVDRLSRRGEERRPRPARGGHAKGGRDLIARMEIANLCDKYGLTPTRNKASEPRSACDAVALALGENYDVIEAIWRKR